MIPLWPDAPLWWQIIDVLYWLAILAILCAGWWAWSK